VRYISRSYTANSEQWAIFINVSQFLFKYFNVRNISFFIVQNVNCELDISFCYLSKQIVKRRVFILAEFSFGRQGYVTIIRGCIQKFPDWVDNEINNNNNNKHLLRATQMIMAAKVTRLTHKIAIQLHPVAENCTVSSSGSMRPIQKILDTCSYIAHFSSIQEFLVNFSLSLAHFFWGLTFRLWKEEEEVVKSKNSALSCQLRNHIAPGMNLGESIIIIFCLHFYIWRN